MSLGGFGTWKHYISHPLSILVSFAVFLPLPCVAKQQRFRLLLAAYDQLVGGTLFNDGSFTTKNITLHVSSQQK